MQEDREGQTSFFSKNHDRLLTIATWAKYLAWVVLCLFVLGGILDFLAQMNMTNAQLTVLGQRALSFSEILRQYPTAALRIIVNAVGTVFKGFVYYLVLMGMSLGLRMIVETDINYREKAKAAQ